MADTYGLGPYGETRGGSSPSGGIVLDAGRTGTHKRGIEPQPDFHKVQFRKIDDVSDDGALFCPGGGLRQT